MRLIRRAAVGAAIVATLAMLVSGCAAGTATPTKSASASTNLTLHLGSFNEPTSFDPAKSPDGQVIPYYQAVYDTLIKQAPDGSFEPMLATKWSYNSDNTVLTLTLRKDVVFSDGSKFDASVAKANLEYFPKANGPQASRLSSVKSIDAVNATTLVLNLSAPDPAMLTYLSTAPGFMASGKAIGTAGLATTPVGSGPYTLDVADSAAQSKYVFVRNDKYWGTPAPYKEVDFLFLGDETARLNALKSGQIDAGLFFQVGNALDGKAAGFQLLQGQSDWQGLTFFDRNGVSEPAIGDVKVRQALIYAINRAGILKNILQGQGAVTAQIFSPSSLGYEKSLDSAYPFDPAKARKLLAEAGYSKGLTVGLPTSPNFDPAIYTTIEQEWKDVGVTVTRTDYGPGQQLAGVIAGKNALAYLSLAQFQDWQQMQLLLTPTSTYNPFHVNDPTVTGLIHDFQFATTDAQRKQTAQKLNEYLVKQAWFAPFYRPYLGYLVNNKKVKVVTQATQAVPSIYDYTPVQ